MLGWELPVVQALVVLQTKKELVSVPEIVWGLLCCARFLPVQTVFCSSGPLAALQRVVLVICTVVMVELQAPKAASSRVPGCHVKPSDWFQKPTSWFYCYKGDVAGRGCSESISPFPHDTHATER